MNTDSDYAKQFFDVWFSGITKSMITEQLGFVVNQGNIYEVKKCQK